MLKGLHPLLAPDLLHALAAMGHGDELAIVDANFPAATVGRRLIELRGVGAAAALDAVLTVFPVDLDAVPAALTMQVIDDPAAVPQPVAEFQITGVAEPVMYAFGNRQPYLRNIIEPLN